MFSIIGFLDAAAYALGTPPAWPMSEAPIESRQFIGWWRDAISDAITSSAYTGERAIHSSDFSAFTKRSHRPSLLRFSGPKILYFGRDSSICTSATAYSGTLFSLRWSAMDYRRCQPPCARFIARDHPHSKCVKCLGFSHARDAVYGIWNVILWESPSHNPPLSDWGVWKEVIHFSPSRSGGLRSFAWIRSLLWIRDEPRESQALKLDERFLSGPNSSWTEEAAVFRRSALGDLQIPETAVFPSRLTNAAAAGFTNLVVMWSRVTPPCLW